MKKEFSNLRQSIFQVKLFIKQLLCNHENYFCDTQIRVIECEKCGHRSRIKDYKNLF